mmetsp:Transcript_16908/g.36593  ORF Transcript_16908/g.36593 Transcript_16908/m.36593 type:complete len:356 (-) Transcript_16908:1239-2306(-)
MQPLLAADLYFLAPIQQKPVICSSQVLQVTVVQDGPVILGVVEVVVLPHTTGVHLGAAHHHHAASTTKAPAAPAHGPTKAASTHAAPAAHGDDGAHHGRSWDDGQEGAHGTSSMCWHEHGAHGAAHGHDRHRHIHHAHHAASHHPHAPAKAATKPAWAPKATTKPSASPPPEVASLACTCLTLEALTLKALATTSGLCLLSCTCLLFLEVLKVLKEQFIVDHFSLGLHLLRMLHTDVLHHELAPEEQLVAKLVAPLLLSMLNDLVLNPFVHCFLNPLALASCHQGVPLLQPPLPALVHGLGHQLQVMCISLCRALTLLRLCNTQHPACCQPLHVLLDSQLVACIVVNAMHTPEVG